ncbi:hypothetical protein J6590_081674 [Homalodisca vitripennis]|nr:hypothetical protein J6590_081674 [Homalodisca vitripennis]
MAANIVHNNELIRRMLEEDIDDPLLEEDEEFDSDHENPRGPYEVSNVARDVVLRMCETIFNSGRNVTLDNWFVTYALVEALTQKDLRLWELTHQGLSLKQVGGGDVTRARTAKPATFARSATIGYVSITLRCFANIALKIKTRHLS